MKRLRRLFSSLLNQTGRSLLWNGRLATGVVGGMVLFVVLATTFRNTPLKARLIHQANRAAASVRSLVTTPLPSQSTAPKQSVTNLRDAPSHPSNRFFPYMQPGADTSIVANPSVLSTFHDVLDQFERRQTTDDNFTIRVTDRRTNEQLQIYELTDLRQTHKQGSSVEWRTVDQRRREVTRTLVDKFERQGVPLKDITVRWGRANQINESLERNRPYYPYEVRLAQSLDLSLLSTQISTVETFNRDDLVSPAGAKSRYQMLPWILRRSGVHEYELSTTAGSRVTVEEALHPLLTMEPAFLLLKGYVNAVGHEIPGLSAYHTGPGNIYMLYRKYFTESTYYNNTSNVVDAYIWALTDGFNTVSEQTSFGSFSRGYVPSLHGALEARVRTPLDHSEAIQTARVQLRPGTRISLRKILTVLDTTDQSFDWGPAGNESSTYARFRALNKHFDLPKSTNGKVPHSGNVQLRSTTEGKGIRFFLPPRAPQVLRASGVDVLDPDFTFRFNSSTFGPPTEAQRTRWDEQYDRLVEDIQRFGFTPENRDRLTNLYEKFKALAKSTPSRYRQRQLAIIRTHRRIWRSNPWEKLSEITMQMTGRDPVPAQPLTEFSFSEDTLSGLK